MWSGQVPVDTGVTRTGSQRYRCGQDRWLKMQMKPGKVVRDTNDARKTWSVVSTSQRFRGGQARIYIIDKDVAGTGRKIYTRSQNG